MAAMSSEMEKARIRSEFEQLQREYRNMEATRKAYAEESLSVIRKQKEAIEKMQKDNDLLKDELDMELRYLSKKPVGEATAAGLHDQLDLYIGKVEIEHRNIEQLQKQIEILRARVVKESRILGGLNAAKESEKALEKQLKVLDNRLEKGLVRFNEVLAGNKELRNTIDALRQERTVFEGVYRKLEKELGERKRAMAALIESSNQAYEARDMAHMEIAKIQQEMNSERVSFETRLSAIDASMDAEADAAKAREAEMRGSLTMEEEETLKRDLKEGQSQIARDAALARQYAAKVEMYERAFSRIKDETGITDVEELVSVFLKNEDANFGLFNYVAEQSAELSRLEETVDTLRKEALQYEAGRKVLLGSAATGGNTRAGGAGMAGGASVSPGRDGGAVTAGGVAATAPVIAAIHSTTGGVPKAMSPITLSKSLEERLTTLTAHTERYDAKAAYAREVLAGTLLRVDGLLRATGADTQPGAELVLTDGKVTETNMMRVLGLIEQRANALLAGYAALQRAASEEEAMVRAQDDEMRGLDGRNSRALLAVKTAEERDSPSKLAAMSMTGAGPSYRSGAAEHRLRPSLPAVSDFSHGEGGGYGGHRAGSPDGDDEGDDEDDEDEDEDGIARPLSLAEIKYQTLRSMSGTGNVGGSGLLGLGGGGGSGGYSSRHSP